MARKRLKCPKCDRRFSMAAHLARHQNTIHKRKPRKKVVKRKKTKRRTRRRAGRATDVEKTGRRRVRHVATVRGTASGLADVLTALRSHLAQVRTERDRISGQIGAVEEAIRTLGA